jgi:hypothetical protein
MTNVPGNLPQGTKNCKLQNRGLIIPLEATSISMPHKKPASQAQSHAKHESATSSSQYKQQNSNPEGKVKIRFVGPGHNPSKNKKWMGGTVPVLGPGMVPALSPREARGEPRVLEAGRETGKEKKVKLVKGGASASN